MKGVDKAGELDVNFAVYKTNEINAFACGDGSIRVYSGLMDVMNDEELVAIIGHELGHLVHQDTKNAMKKAYLAAAAVDVVAAAGNVGAIAASTLGDISQAFINAQFSQKQEYAADQYGFEFAISRGQSAYSMCNALNKLVELSGSSASSSAVAKMFSSHPNSAERAEKMKAAADKYQKKQLVSDTAVATWRHWLPKREGTHVCGEDRQGGYCRRSNIELVLFFISKNSRSDPDNAGAMGNSYFPV